MKHTLNYRLNLPEKDDAVEVNDLNQNFRKIDDLIHNDSITIKQNIQKIQHLQDKKADTSYVDAQVELAGKVDSVNGKQGDVILTAKDVKINIGSSTDVYTSLQSKADRVQTNKDISSLRAESSQHKSDIENLRSVKADKSYVDEQMVSAGKVHTVNGKAGYVTLTGLDIQMSNGDRTNLYNNINKNSKRIDDSIKIVRNKYIYSSNWSSYNGEYRARVTDSNITSNSIVDMNIHLDYLKVAKDIYPVTDSHSGGFYVYSKYKPKETIKFDYKVIKEV